MPKPKAGETGLVRDEAHAVTRLINRVQRRGAATTFLVLDACRDNPFAATGVRSIGGSRGLTRVEAPNGVFVLFSAGIGQSALDRLSDDDRDANSVFTRKLVPLLRQPGLSHVQLAKQVQEDVSALARSINHQQQPAYYDQIIGEIVLSPKTSGQPAASNETAAAGGEDAANTWAVIQNTKSAGVLEAFIERYPSSVFVEFAKARLEEVGTGSEEKTGEVVAAVEPPPVKPPEIDRQLVRAIQSRLNWHRCNAGAVDGAWGNRSRRAVDAFARHTKRKLATRPSQELLDILNGHTSRACPAVAVNTPPAKKKTAKAVPDTDNKPASRVFRNPRVKGLPVDICFTRFKRCKGAVATVFCRRKGYRTASAHTVAIYPKTRHLGNGGICQPRGLVLCGGYSTITCVR